MSSREAIRRRALFGPTARTPGDGRKDPDPEPQPHDDEPVPPPPWQGLMRMLDHQGAKAWEASLGRADREKWDALKASLSTAGPDMRWRAVAWVLRAEINHARRAYRIAMNVDDEQFKADVIKRNGVHMREVIERLEARLAEVYPLVHPLGRLLVDLWDDVKRVEDARGLLVKVCSRGTWGAAWSGAARGKGITGYSSEEEVERVRREVQAAHARWQREQERKAEKRGRGRTRRSAKAHAGAPTRQRSITGDSSSQ